MKPSHSCVLSNLDNPLLNGLALGLSCTEDGQVGLQVDMFPCCSALGMAWDDDQGGVRSCTLQARLKRVQKLYYHYRQAWPQAIRHPHQLPTPFTSLILQEVASVLKRDKPQAQINFISQKNQPSLVWSKALATLWRFGVEARVLNLMKSDPRELVAFTSDHHGPIALFVEQIDKLWDPLHAETLEHLVQRAYNADAFLWLEFVGEQQSEPDDNGDLSVKAEFSRRIARKRKSQHPLDNLSRDCMSRLQSMCGQILKHPSGAAHD
jgi:hypothetical protein